MSAKIGELGEYHPYVQAILEGGVGQRDLALRRSTTSFAWRNVHAPVRTASATNSQARGRAAPSGGGCRHGRAAGAGPPEAVARSWTRWRRSGSARTVARTNEVGSRQLRTPREPTDPDEAQQAQEPPRAELQRRSSTSRLRGVSDGRHRCRNLRLDRGTLADEKVVDMDPKMRKLDPDTTQFTTMTSGCPRGRPHARRSTGWRSSTSTTCSPWTPATRRAPSRSPALGGGRRLHQAGRHPPQHDDGRGRSRHAVERRHGRPRRRASVGAAANAAGTTGDKLLFIGSAFRQGASLPDPKYSQRVLGFNYTQIFRTVLGVRGHDDRDRAVRRPGACEGSSPQDRRAQARAGEQRLLRRPGLLHDGHGPQGAAGGLIEFITTNRADVNGELTSDFLDLFLATVLAKGSSDKVIFTGTIGAYYISRFHRAGRARSGSRRTRTSTASRWTASSRACSATRSRSS